MERHLFEGSL